MKALVCISNVPDTTTRIIIAPNSKSIVTDGIQWIINPWDELALTRALELKDENKISEIVVITVGTATTEATLRKALATGADKAVRIDTEARDAWQVASNLASYLGSHPFDVVMCGIESSDFNGSIVGGMLAALAGYPLLSSVSSLDIDGTMLKVQQEIDGGKQWLEAPAPAVLVVQKGIAIVPRIPSMRGIMTARTKPLEVIAPSGHTPSTEVVKLELPPPKGKCHLIDADSAGDLIRLLHEEAKVI